MDIYVTLCCDRHADPEVFVFLDRDDAIAQARLFAAKYARHPSDIEEEQLDGWEYYTQYSEEGDYARVTKEILYDHSLFHSIRE